MLYFQLRDPRRDGDPRQFYFNSEFTIGGAPDNEVVLVDPEIQPAHAEVVVEYDTYWLQEAGNRVALRAGDQLALGPYELSVTRADGAVARGSESAESAERRAPPVARTAVEAALLDALRANPRDDATLEVYADHLEQAGHVEQAVMARVALGAVPDNVRLQLRAPPREAMWRARVTRPPIDRCVEFDFQCPQRWDRLTPTPQDDVRHCGVCDREVFFCTSVEQARALGRNQACIAIDASLSREQACASYDLGDRPLVRSVLGRPSRG